MRFRRGFTLVELLVVIAVLAILVALLIPAVQFAREAARRTSCANNFKQTSLGVLNFESVNGHLPSIVDPGFENPWDIDDPSRSQWVGWRYTILPFLEENGLHDALNEPHHWTYEYNERAGSSIQPAIVTPFLCPSVPGSPLLHPTTQVVGRSDRSALYDAFAVRQTSTVTMIIADSIAWPGAWSGSRLRENDGERESVNPGRLRWITDGTSKTILIAESTRLADNPSKLVSWIQGLTPQWYKGREFKPQGPSSSVNSFHSSGCHVSMCDGSIRFLSKNVPGDTVFALAARANGNYRGR